MKKVITYLTVSLALIQPVFAALPPLYQGANEIKAILSHEDLGQVLTSADIILDIQKDEGGYLITTNKRKVQANIIYTPNEMPGPIPFRVKFVEAKAD